MPNDAETLDSILGKVQKGSSLLPDELRTVVDAFTSEQEQSKAYLTLSLLWQNAGKGEGTTSIESLTEKFHKITMDYLSETSEQALIRGITFLTALYRVDVEAASAIFTIEGTLENIMDSVELSPSVELSLAVARLLAEASGHKKSRATLTSGVRTWLDVQSSKQTSSELAAASIVALVKLWHGASSDSPNDSVSEATPGIDVNRLTTQLKTVVIDSSDQSTLAEAVEGLAYLTTKPSIKEYLSKDAAFLKRLIETIPIRKASWNNSPSPVNSALLYGIVTIIHNLSRYQPILSDEQRQIEKLKKMASAAQGSQPQPDEDSKLDANDYVKARIQRLINANVLPALSVVALLSDSQAIQRNVGKILLSIVEEKEVRGRVLQSGGSKALRHIIKRLAPEVDKTKDWTSGPVDLEPIQALAKLTITSPPIHVYGPDVGAICDAIRPLSLLVLHQSANSLQQFEGMMALTNLASHGPDVASRIASVDGLLNKVELLLLEDHTLVCRASMELICNLVSGSEAAFTRYAGDGKGKAPKSKIHVVLALCDVDDVPTRLAASGTLAILASSPPVCYALFDLQLEKGRFLSIIIALLSPISQDNTNPKEDKNLIHRAAVCVQSFVSHLDSSQLESIKKLVDFSKLRDTMVELIKRSKSVDLGEALAPLAEATRVVLEASK
ncbi:microfilament motor [Coprinopsis cinerea AmutBmut pab1-1]|nr:microfilament motor [Coprinopsis cinerea AmutBmut pab1-1]